MNSTVLPLRAELETSLIRHRQRIASADPWNRKTIFEEIAADVAKRVASRAMGRDEAHSELNDIAAYNGVGRADAAGIIGRAFDNAAAAARAALAPRVLIERASDVQSEAIRWLWRGYLARGKLHLLGGAPSAGKTTLALAIAATVSRGGNFPDAWQAKRGKVLIWSGEDGVADTLRPRLEAAGADLDGVLFLQGVRERGQARSFDPAKDIAMLEAAVAEVGDVALMVVDPIISAVAGDSHKNAEVRRALQPVVDLLERSNIAGLGITHFSKGTAGRDPTERITGSIAFGALARIVLVAAKEEPKDGADEPADDDRRILTRAKSNIGPDGGGFSYRVEEATIAGGITTTRAVWGGALDGSARDLLGKAEAVDQGDDTGGAAFREACDFIKLELANGPVPVKDFQRAATDAGISKRTLERARQHLGVNRHRSGFGAGGTWTVSLRTAEGHTSPKDPYIANPESLAMYGRVGDLWDESDPEVQL